MIDGKNLATLILLGMNVIWTVEKNLLFNY